MWVCDGIKLSVGRTFDPVAFLWLWIDTLYSSMFTSMHLVGYMKVIYPSNINILKLLWRYTQPNGKWRDVRWIIQQSTGVLVDIICWEAFDIVIQSTSILCIRRMGNTQHNTHITTVGIICKYNNENRGYILHIAQGYHHRIRSMLLLRMTHSGMSYSMWYLGENYYKL